MNALVTAIRQRVDTRTVWLLGVLLFLILALTRPSLSLQRDVFNTIFVIDISQSMNTRDYQIDAQSISRLQIVKQRLSDSLRTMPCGSKAGLAIFTEYRTFLLLAPVEVCKSFAELSGSIAQISGKMAWAGGSEIAKGLNWGLKMAIAVDPKPSLVFLTDGQEAPPISMRNRPRIDVEAGMVQGLLVGVGGDTLSPIPKMDPDGNALGFWRADEVAQIDIYSQGRATSIAGEKVAGTDSAEAMKNRPKTEHLSSVKEPYLRQLADENGLKYARLYVSGDIVSMMSDARLGQTQPVPMPISWLPALIALACLVRGYFLRAD